MNEDPRRFEGPRRFNDSQKKSIVVVVVVLLLFTFLPLFVIGPSGLLMPVFFWCCCGTFFENYRRGLRGKPTSLDVRLFFSRRWVSNVERIHELVAFSVLSLAVLALNALLTRVAFLTGPRPVGLLLSSACASLCLVLLLPFLWMAAAVGRRGASIDRHLLAALVTFAPPWRPWLRLAVFVLPAAALASVLDSELPLFRSFLLFVVLSKAAACLGRLARHHADTLEKVYGSREA